MLKSQGLMDDDLFGAQMEKTMVHAAVRIDRV